MISSGFPMGIFILWGLRKNSQTIYKIIDLMCYNIKQDLMCPSPGAGFVGAVRGRGDVFGRDAY